jgi:hypothetical protein
MGTTIVFTEERNLYDMIVLEIENIKMFMSKLLVGDLFDQFHVGNCEVTTFVDIHIDGRRHDSWYDTGEKPEDSTGQVTWHELKPVLYQLIKGKKTPEKMRLDFCHYMANGDVGSLRVEYDREGLKVYTGYMQKEFSLDKQKQQEWDDYCEKFITKVTFHRE